MTKIQILSSNQLPFFDTIDRSDELDLTEDLKLISFGWSYQLFQTQNQKTLVKVGILPQKLLNILKYCYEEGLSLSEVSYDLSYFVTITNQLFHTTKINKIKFVIDKVNKVVSNSIGTYYLNLTKTELYKLDSEIYFENEQFETPTFTTKLIKSLPEGHRFKILKSGHDFFVLSDTCLNFYTWGNNLNNQLGQPNLQYADEPKLLISLTGIPLSKVKLGYQHCLVITELDQIFTFGSNRYNQLGLTKKDEKLNEEVVEDIIKLPDFIHNGKDIDVEVDKVSCGAFHTLVLDKHGNLWSTDLNWGISTFGDSGDKIVEVQGGFRRIDRASLKKMEVIKIFAGYNTTTIQYK